jgi:hypothetical protein
VANIEFKITADSADDLVAALASVNATFAKYAASPAAIAAATANPANDGPSDPEPPKASRAPKQAPKKAEETPQEAGGPLVSPTLTAEPAAVLGATSAPVGETAPAVPYEDVRAAVTKLATTKGREAVIAVLDSFGVDHASKLPQDKWGEALAALVDSAEG